MSDLSSVKNICVYCGSRPGGDAAYQTAAQKVGALIAARDWGLVYGGGNTGLMGEVANAALKGGAKVTGVIPKDLMQYEVAHKGLSELIVSNSMHERKMEMVRRSDAFVILPGGLGSLDELFEIVTWKQLGFHQKPIVIVNVAGYWGALDSLFQAVVSGGFARDVALTLFRIVPDVEGIEAAVQDMLDNPGPSSPAKKWQ